MSSNTPLDNWRFLVGEWKGGSEGQFGGKGTIESKATFIFEPSDRFIMGTHEAWREGALENKSITLLYYDQDAHRFIRKSFFSYGWCNNEVEYASNEHAIRFEVEIEPFPKSFEGMRWRSYITRVSDDEIRMGLEVAKKGEDFKIFGDSVMKRVG
jgi:hypothetical protein